jgi:hypothetical protein
MGWTRHLARRKSISEFLMTNQLGELTLRHVDPSKLLFLQRHPAFPVEEPDWYTNASSGGLGFTSWLRGTVLATMEMRVEKPAYYAVVSVLGLFGSDEQERAQAKEFSSEIDEEMAAFAKKAVNQLYPFLRTEIYALTGKMQGVSGVMLQPYPLARDDEMRVMSIRDGVRHQANEFGLTVSHNTATRTDTFEGPGGSVALTYESDYQGLLGVDASNANKYPSTPAGVFAALRDIATPKS